MSMILKFPDKEEDCNTFNGWVQTSALYITENGEQKISDTSSTTRELNVGYSPLI